MTKAHEYLVKKYHKRHPKADPFEISSAYGLDEKEVAQYLKEVNENEN